MVENPYFQEAIRYMEPRYDLMGRKAMARRVLEEGDRFFNFIKAYLKPVDRIVIAMDLWTALYPPDLIQIPDSKKLLV